MEQVRRVRWLALFHVLPALLISPFRGGVLVLHEHSDDQAHIHRFPDHTAYEWHSFRPAHNEGEVPFEDDEPPAEPDAPIPLELVLSLPSLERVLPTGRPSVYHECPGRPAQRPLPGVAVVSTFSTPPHPRERAGPFLYDNSTTAVLLLRNHSLLL